MAAQQQQRRVWKQDFGEAEMPEIGGRTVGDEAGVFTPRLAPGQIAGAQRVRQIEPRPHQHPLQRLRIIFYAAAKPRRHEIVEGRAVANSNARQMREQLLQQGRAGAGKPQQP